MEMVAIVIVVALVQYTMFGALVGRARSKYNVAAPSISGHPVFERYYRVHQNTLESLVLFIPAILLFATYVRADLAAGIGVVFIIGRFIYLRAYVADPKSRSLGFLLTILPAAVLIVGGAIGNVIDRFLHPGVVDFLDFHLAGWHWPARRPERWSGEHAAARADAADGPPGPAAA